MRNRNLKFANVVVKASQFLEDYYNVLTEDMKKSNYGQTLRAMIALQKEIEDDVILDSFEQNK